MEHVFVSYGIKRRLLAHARAAGEPPELIRKARRLLRRPRKARPHNDHIHLRIACTVHDMKEGRCRQSPAPSGKVRGGPVACPPRYGQRAYLRASSKLLRSRASLTSLMYPGRAK